MSSVDVCAKGERGSPLTPPGRLVSAGFIYVLSKTLSNPFSDRFEKVQIAMIFGRLAKNDTEEFHLARNLLFSEPIITKLSSEIDDELKMQADHERSETPEKSKQDSAYISALAYCKDSQVNTMVDLFPF